ncbi:MAG TPA: hypothetical protein VKQ36_06635, partial [Ktedonobacterales bacterium]|nr:hypothetical protein [Ktedonobacterales bacterium]
MTLPTGALAPHLALASLASSSVLVAAAGVVVVLAILLVFVMVIRSNGAARRTASGVGYDAANEPPGGPQAASRGRAGAQGANDYGGYANGYNDSYASSYDDGAYGRAPQRAGAGSGQRGSGYGDQQDGWGASVSPPQQGRWNEQAAQPIAQGQQRGAPQWGAPDENWSAGDGWNRGAAPVSRPGVNPFSGSGSGPNSGQMRPQGQPSWDAPQGPQGPQSGVGGRAAWGGAQGGAWDADPSQQDWGAVPGQQQDW